MTKRNVMVIVYGVLIVLLVHMLLRLVAKDNQRLVTVLTIFSIVIAVGVSIAAILLGTDWGCKIF